MTACDGVTVGRGNLNGAGEGFACLGDKKGFSEQGRLTGS